MTAAAHLGLVVKLRPIAPWRCGPATGARDCIDSVYHSDSVYSAITAAMRLLGSLDEWLDATARNAAVPAVRFSSLFLFQNEIGFVIPPRTVWPPAPSTKVRWKSARFIPLGLVAPLLAGRPLEEDQWDADGPSECLVPAGRTGPVCVSTRAAAAVDRLTGRTAQHSAACLEFAEGAGLWGVVAFADEPAKKRWEGPVRAAFRYLADSGFGGERSRGWGRADTPEFIEGMLPGMILADTATPVVESADSGVITTPGPGAADAPASVEVLTPAAGEGAALDTPTAYWLLSLFSPHEQDSIDWGGGNYSVVARSGRVDSRERTGELKKSVNMIAEGSVLVSPGELRGTAMDVAPDGFSHPVYRAGFAVSIPVRALVAP